MIYRMVELNCRACNEMRQKLSKMSVTFASNKKRSFRRNGMTSNDCLPYENFSITFFCSRIAPVFGAFSTGP
jgi:hypothetical protein